MGENLALKQEMEDLGLKQEKLAEILNDALLVLTGRPGNISSRTIRNWLAGTHHRPVAVTCTALEQVFGCPVENLGLMAPRSMRKPEAPVRRRTFFSSTAGTAAATAPIIKQRRSVGMSDVSRAETEVSSLVQTDDRRGGHAALAAAATAGRAKLLELQQRNASERVRRHLYALAAEYTNIAAWAFLDARNLDAAQVYVNESTAYAGLSQDPPTSMRAWVIMSSLANQRQNWPEQLAAAQAAQASPAARRDPFFDSMGRVRVALAHSALGEIRASQRLLAAAERALDRVRSEDRPPWAAFYGTAELNHLAAIIHRRNGDPAGAEYMAHRALTGIPSAFRRNRALATCQLALAQLRQGEPEQATQTASAVFTTMDGAPLPGRMRTLIGDFHRELLVLAPSTSYARDWADRMRDEWSRA